MDHTYLIEMRRDREKSYKPVHVVFSTAFPPPNLLLKPNLDPGKIVEDIPSLFSQESYPFWIKKIYRETEIDLTLLSFLNQTQLYRRTPGDPGTFQTILFPAERGPHRLTVDTQAATEPPRPENPPALSLEIICPGSLETTSYPITRMEHQTISFNMPSNGFLRISAKGLEENRIQIYGISLIPDFKKDILDTYCKK